MDDIDIKIASNQVADEISERIRTQLSVTGTDVAKNVDALKYMDVAKEIGFKLAFVFNSTITDDETDLDIIFSQENILNHVRILFVFSVVTSIEQIIQNDVIASAVQNAFYNEIISIDSELYENLSDTGAFTFYYLALRRDVNVASEMGNTFAMLVGTDDTEIVDFGKRCYLSFTQISSSLLEEAEL